MIITKGMIRKVQDVIYTGQTKVRRPPPKHFLNMVWESGQQPDAPSVNPWGKMHKEITQAMAEKDEKPCMRPNAMRRRRERLAAQKRKAMEAHELQQMARENAVDAMRSLIEISTNERAPEATRIAASQAILDRGYGKASQTSITANVTNHGKASEITADELDQRVKSALARAEALTNRTGKAAESPKRPTDVRQLN